MMRQIKCQIKWIDRNGKQTPDENDAVAIANAHEIIWSHPNGSPDNHVVGYSDKIRGSFPICADHLSQMREKTQGFRGWSVSELPKEQGQ